MRAAIIAARWLAPTRAVSRRSRSSRRRGDGRASADSAADGGSGDGLGLTSRPPSAQSATRESASAAPGASGPTTPSRPATRSRRSPSRPACRSRTIQRLNPDLDAQALPPGQKLKLRRVSVAARRALRAAGSPWPRALAVCACALPARPPARGAAAPPPISRSCGDRHRGRRPATSSSRATPTSAGRSPRTTKLMTALLDAPQRLRLTDRRHRAALRRGAGRVASSGCAPGERMRGARPAARAAARLAPTTPPRRSPSASRAAREPLRALDEPRARGGSAAQHALRQPDRARRPWQLLLGAGPRASSRSILRAQRFFRADHRPRSARRCAPATARAHDRQPQHARAQASRWSTASRPATRSRAGYVLVGSATRGGVTVVSAVLGEPSDARARPRHARAAALGPAALRRRSPRSSAARWPRAPECASAAPRAPSPRAPRARRRFVVRRGDAPCAATVGAPRESSTVRCPRGAPGRDDRVVATAAGSRPRAAGHRPAGARGPLTVATRDQGGGARRSWRGRWRVCAPRGRDL